MITTKHQALAFDIAKELDDQKNLGLYMKIAKKNDEFVLRKLLSEVRDIAHKKEIYNKGAYFMTLFWKYKINNK